MMRALLFLVASALTVGAITAVACSFRDARDEEVTPSTDFGQPPPCFDSWQEAFAQGYPSPDPNKRVVFITQPRPTDGPPFDLTQRTPPAGFDSWAEVIDLWTEAKDLGLFDPGTEVSPQLTVPTFDDAGTPPPGCDSWQDFIDWAQQVRYPPATPATPNRTPIALRRFNGAPPPCFSSVQEMHEWYRSSHGGAPYVAPLPRITPEPPFNCTTWDEFHQYMDRRFPG